MFIHTRSLAKTGLVVYLLRGRVKIKSLRTPRLWLEFRYRYHYSDHISRYESIQLWLCDVQYVKEISREPSMSHMSHEPWYLVLEIICTVYSYSTLLSMVSIGIFQNSFPSFQFLDLEAVYFCSLHKSHKHVSRFCYSFVASCFFVIRVHKSTLCSPFVVVGRWSARNVWILLFSRCRSISNNKYVNYDLRRPQSKIHIVL